MLGAFRVLTETSFGRCLSGLFGGEFDVGAGGEGDDFELAGVLVDDGERLAADGAGGAENGYAFHARISLGEIHGWAKDNGGRPVTEDTGKNG